MSPHFMVLRTWCCTVILTFTCLFVFSTLKDWLVLKKKQKCVLAVDSDDGDTVLKCDHVNWTSTRGLAKLDLGVKKCQNFVNVCGP